MPSTSTSLHVHLSLKHAGSPPSSSKRSTCSPRTAAAAAHAAPATAAATPSRPPPPQAAAPPAPASALPPPATTARPPRRRQPPPRRAGTRPPRQLRQEGEEAAGFWALPVPRRFFAPRWRRSAWRAARRAAGRTGRRAAAARRAARGRCRRRAARGRWRRRGGRRRRRPGALRARSPVIQLAPRLPCTKATLRHQRAWSSVALQRDGWAGGEKPAARACCLTLRRPHRRSLARKNLVDAWVASLAIRAGVILPAQHTSAIPHLLSR